VAGEIRELERCVRCLACVLALWGTGAGTPAAAEVRERTALRVCADPYSLPSSNKAQQGYENQIARLFAEALDIPLQFEWFPQRIGFIRNTLHNNDTPDKRYKCDLVMGVPENADMVAASRPYFRTTWAFVYVEGRGLDSIRSIGDLPALAQSLRKPLAIGSFDRSPATAWMAANGMLSTLKPYQSMSGDAREYPGRVIEQDLVAGKIDGLFIFAPIAGYFADRIRQPRLKLVLLGEEHGRFEFQLAAGVRHGEEEWLATINALIDVHQNAIYTILYEYGVPVLPLRLN
jgi:mxaJ protein